MAKITLKSNLVERFNAVPTGVTYPTTFEGISRDSTCTAEERTGTGSRYETEYVLEGVFRQYFTVPNSCKLGTMGFDNALRNAKICASRKLYGGFIEELYKVLELINRGERAPAANAVRNLIQSVDKSV